MIGLGVEGRPLIRAYSIVSANHDEHLEFLSIKVPDGPLTSRLQQIQPGDQIVDTYTTLGPGECEDLGLAQAEGHWAVHVRILSISA